MTQKGELAGSLFLSVPPFLSPSLILLFPTLSAVLVTQSGTSCFNASGTIQG